MKQIPLAFLITFIVPFVCLAASGDLNARYKYDYTQPPEFQPSLNSQFTTLAHGVVDVLANPAGITDVNTIEIAFGLSGYVNNPIRSDTNSIYIDDAGMEGLEQAPNSRAYVRITDDRTAVSPEPRAVTVDEDYSKGGGFNYFGMTYKVADWLAFSISRRRPTVMSFDYSAFMPVMVDVKADFRGATFEAGNPGDYIRIRYDGTIEAVIAGMPHTSEVSAWSGFLDQGTSEVNWVNGIFDNSIANHNSVVITTAIKTGQVSWGLNVIPESVDIELNNEMYVQSDANNSNLKFYLPKTNFGSTLEALYWVTSEVQTPAGYHSMEVETLPGQQLGSAKVAGKYSGSFVRMDLGMQWEPTDWFTLAGVYENFNGATLKLEGVNIIQYVQHRLDTTAKMPTEESASYWNPFLPDPTHEVEVENVIRNTLTMQPIELPKKLKFGCAFKKPFLIAVDWEQWQNEYRFTSDPGHPETAHYITISDITFLKLGMESQFWFFPVIMRGSLTSLLRPTTNDPELEKNFDDLYQSLPVVPVDGNLYFGFGLLDGEWGFGFGGGGLPLLRAVMLDMSGIAKVFYLNTYFKKGDWQVSYLMTMDPVLTAFSSDISTTAGIDSDIRLMQTSTLSIGFRF